MWLMRTAKENAMHVVIAKVIRHGLTIAGGAGVVSDDQVGQLAGAVAAILGILWSVVPEILEQRRKKAANGV